MIGFDYARTENEPGRLGSATGIVNVGGFVASLSTILLIGLVLSWSTRAAPATTRSATSAARCACSTGCGRSASWACSPRGGDCGRCARRTSTRSRARSRAWRATGASDGGRRAADWTTLAASTMLTAQVRPREAREAARRHPHHHRPAAARAEVPTRAAGRALGAALPGVHPRRPRALRADVHGPARHVPAVRPDDRPRRDPPAADRRAAREAPRQRGPQAAHRRPLDPSARAGRAPRAPQAPAPAVPRRARAARTPSSCSGSWTPSSTAGGPATRWRSSRRRRT